MKKTYRWDNLTRPEIEELVAKQAIVIIPLGSTEQHGPHLMVGADALLSTGISELVAQKLIADGHPAVVAPTISVANSIHHMDFPGTITLQPTTYMQMLLEYCQCLAKHGFKKIAMINGHGGNNFPTQTAIITINEALGFPVYFMSYECGSEKEIDGILESQPHGIHACEMETSVALHLYPDLVDPSYKETSYGGITKQNGGRPAGPYTFRRFKSRTPIGMIGNANMASPEKGKRLVDQMTVRLAELIADLW